MDNLDAHHCRRKRSSASPASAMPTRSSRPRRAILGKTGALTELLKGLGKLPAEERPRGGRADQRSEGRSSKKRCARGAARSRRATLEARLAEEALDVTLPGRGRGRRRHPSGHAHLERIEDTLPFDRLRSRRRSRDRDRLLQLHRAQSAGEPSGALDARHVLSRRRTGTAAAHAHLPDADALHGARTSRRSRSSRRAASYRVDSDATHSPMFHQVEGLWIDEHISFADLKGVLTDFLRSVSSSATTCRCASGRRSFPFTEPSAEIDMSLQRPHKGRWLEIAGCGQVHPTCRAQRRPRPGAHIGLRLRHGPRAPDDAALRRQRPAAVLRRRSALPEAVQLSRQNHAILRKLAAHLRRSAARHGSSSRTR